MLVQVLFYGFAAVLIAAALGVIIARNPVHAALFLVLSFVTSAAIWLLLELVVSSPFGRTLAAIRQNPSRVAALGGRVFLYRLAAFTASGAIAGVLGAYLLFFPTARLVVMFPIFFFPFFFEIPAVFYLALWFFTQLFSGTMALAGPQQVGGIAWWAHIGGFVVGMLSCWLFVKKPSRRMQPDEYGAEWAWEPRRR